MRPFRPRLAHLIVSDGFSRRENRAVLGGVFPDEIPGFAEAFRNCRKTPVADKKTAADLRRNQISFFRRFWARTRRVRLCPKSFACARVPANPHGYTVPGAAPLWKTARQGGVQRADFFSCLGRRLHTMVSLQRIPLHAGLYGVFCSKSRLGPVCPHTDPAPQTPRSRPTVPTSLCASLSVPPARTHVATHVASRAASSPSG